MAVSRARRHTRYLHVDLENVRLALGGRPVLRNISWSIHPGQRWVLIGANGAGKTQLLKLLAGDVWPIILPNLAVLAGMAVLLFGLTRVGFRKQLD